MAALVTVGTIVVAAPGAVAAPAVGVQIMAAHSGKCIDVYKALTEPGTAVHQVGCNGQANQRWRTVPKGDGTVQIVAEHSGRCLDVFQGLQDPGTRVEQHSCHDGPNQRWTVRPVPRTTLVQLVVKHSGKCLDVPASSEADTVQLEQHTCHDGLNQRWYVPPASTKPPAVTVDQSSPMAVLQSSPNDGSQYGAVHYAYVDNIGRLLHVEQRDPENPGTPTFTPISGGEAFSGRPALAERADKRLQLLAHNTDSDAWLATQKTRGLAGWEDWADTGGSTRNHPTLGRLPGANSGLVGFAIDTAGSLWHLPIEETQAPVLGWRSAGGAQLTGTPVVVQSWDGLQVFAVDAEGRLRSAYYRSGSLTDFVVVGAGVSGQPAVVVSPGFRTRVVARAADGGIVTKQQDLMGNWPDAWQRLGAFGGPGQPAAILDPVVGRTAVVARGADGDIHVSWETAQGSGSFGAWRRLGRAESEADAAVTDPTVAPVTNSSGQTWLIAFRNRNDRTVTYWRDANAVPPVEAARAAPSSDVPAPTFQERTLPAPPR
jgi:hypothetical protein